MTRLHLILFTIILILSNIIFFNWGINYAKSSYVTIKYQEEGTAYCWNVEVYKIKQFDYNRMTMKVRRVEK